MKGREESACDVIMPDLIEADNSKGLSLRHKLLVSLLAGKR